VYLCGNDACVGNWVPPKGLKLATSSQVYPQWVGRLVLDKPIQAGGVLGYKYVIKTSDGGWMWEDRIPDRKVGLDRVSGSVMG